MLSAHTEAQAQREAAGFAVAPTTFWETPGWHRWETPQPGVEARQGWRVLSPGGRTRLVVLTEAQAQREAAHFNLDPIMRDAEVFDRPQRFTLCSYEGDYGPDVLVDPSSRESLEAGAAAIREAAWSMGVDGRVMFTCARRQLGDIAVTLAALAQED